MNESPEKAKLSIEELSSLKDGIQNIDISSSESDIDIDINTDTDTDTSSILVNKKKKKIHKNSNTNTKFKYINKKLESRIHYMKLDIVNKDIEIEELRNKMISFDKNLNIFKHINYLFERLDNGIMVLNQRLDSNNESDISKYIYFLEHTYTLCYNVKTKYQLYLYDTLFPLLDNNHEYLKKSTLLLFQIKESELLLISSKINNKIKDNQNKQFLLSFLNFLCIFIMIAIICFIIYKLLILILK